MEVKGAALASVPVFVLRKFGPEGLSRWLNSLSPRAHEIYKGTIPSGSWYPLEEVLEEPLQKICDLFYWGDLRGAREGGRFGADMALKGIKRLLTKMSPPEALLCKAGALWRSQYQPAQIKVRSPQEGKALIHLIGLVRPAPLVESRFWGWLERVLEIGGQRRVKVRITRSLTQGHPYTEFIATWS